MPLAASRVNVTDAGVQVYDAGNAYDRLVIRNAGADAVFLGPAGVTAATGYELAAAATLTLDVLAADDDVHAICAAAGTATLHVLGY